MAKFDMSSEIKIVRALDPKSQTSTGNVDGQGIDTKGFESVTFAFANGALADLVSTIEIQESSDNSVFTAVADADLVELESTLTIAADDDNAVAQIGYIGAERYVRARYVVATASGANLIAAVCILGNPHRAPTTQAAFA